MGWRLYYIGFQCDVGDVLDGGLEDDADADADVFEVGVVCVDIR